MWPETIINAEGYETEGISAGTDADAALIAAAPDLLESLKALAQAVAEEADASNSISGNMSARLTDARNAIAAATNGAASTSERSGT